MTAWRSAPLIVDVTLASRAGYDRGFDKGFAREYAGDATDSFSGNLSQRLTVDRWDLTRQKCSYKTEGDQRDKTTYVMEFDGAPRRRSRPLVRDSSTRRINHRPLSTQA